MAIEAIVTTVPANHTYPTALHAMRAIKRKVGQAKRSGVYLKLTTQQATNGRWYLISHVHGVTYLVQRGARFF